MSDHPMHFTTDDPDNPDGPKLQWIRVPVTKASTAKKPEYVELCLSKLGVTEYAELIWRGAKSVINMGATKVPGDKSESSKKAAIEKAQEQVEKCYAAKIRITGGRSKTGDSQEVMVLARSKAVKRLKAQAKREGKVKVSLVAASKWTALAKQYLDTEHGEAIIAEARAEVAAYEKTTVGLDLSDLKEDEALVKKANERKSAKKKAGDDADEALAGMIAQATKKGGEQRVSRH